MTEKIRIATDSHGKLRRRQTSNAIKPLPKMLLLFALALFCTAFASFAEAANSKKLSLSTVGKMLGIGKKKPATSAPPKTIQDKAASIEPLCDEVECNDVGFAQYCRTVYQNNQNNHPTFDAITHLDLIHMKTIVAMENKRNPGLNLVYLGDMHPDALVDAIKKAQQEMPSGSTVRFIFSTLVESFHYGFAEAKVTKNSAKVVLFDSTFPKDNKHVQTPYNLLKKEKFKVSIVAPEIQKSDYDCVMFSLNFALKSFETGFGQKLNNNLFETTITQKNLNKLPIDFFKHSQTRKLPDKLLNKPVGKGDTTLQNRLDANRQVRDIGEGKTKDLSTSIEGFRMQEIRRVVEAYQQGPSAFDHSLEKLYVSTNPRLHPPVLIRAPNSP